MNRFFLYSAAVCVGAVLILLSTKGSEAGSITLSLGVQTVTFPSKNPSSVSSIGANENPIDLSLNYSGLGTWAATMLATSNLTGSAGSIPITAVHYVGTGVFNTSGTLSILIPSSLGVGVFTPTPLTGTLSFYFDNSWTYAVGTYSTSIVITAVTL